jgi:hypothetical protein
MTLESAIAFAKEYAPDMPEEEMRLLLEKSYQPATGETYEDRPQQGAGTHWGDRKGKRVRLAYIYYRRGNGWRYALLCGGGTISDQPSPYTDEDGDPCNAMILQSCYIDRENNRYGMVTGWIPMQDEINKRRSKALHMLNSRQTQGQKGAVDVAKTKRELALPDGHVEYEQDPASSVPSFAVIPNNDQLAGQFELLQESKAEIDMIGPNASLLGQLEGENSGRAIIAQQQAGMAEIAPFYDNLRDWTIRVYRAVWCRIRQFWTEPRWIRVTDEQERLQFLGINGAMNPGDPNAQPGPMVADLDVDIMVDVTQDYASLQIEQFQQLVELVKGGLVQLPPEIIIQASQLHDKAKIMEMLNSPEQAQKAQMQEQVAMEGAMAEIEEKKASAMLKQAQAQKAIAESQQSPEQQPDTAPLEFEKIASAERQTAAKLQSEAEVKAADANKKRVEAEAILKELRLKEQELTLKAQDMRLREAEVSINAKKTDADIQRGDRELSLNEKKTSGELSLGERKLQSDAQRGERQDGLAEKKIGNDARAAGVSDKKRKRKLTPVRDKNNRIVSITEEEVD